MATLIRWSRVTAAIPQPADIRVMEKVVMPYHESGFASRSVLSSESVLSPESAAAVRATAATVVEHAVEVSSNFYATMFAARPELLRVFNKGNQANGTQQRALAGAVFGFALNLVDPDADSIEPVLTRIAYQHVSLGIRPDQYTIVGRYLLSAIASALGDAATTTVTRAWDEVYWLLATQMIAAEARLYNVKDIDPNHPWQRYEVLDRVDEAIDTVSLVMRPAEGGPVPNHVAGQYVSVAVDLPDGSRQARQYTIPTGPHPDTVQITVRRVRGGDHGAPDGVVSGYLCTAVAVGDTLEMTSPSGNVVLDDNASPLLLVSAGIGITAVSARLEDIARRTPKRPVVAAHVDRSALHDALRDTVAKIGTNLEDFTTYTWYDHPDGSQADRTARSGRMDLREIQVPPGARAFMCGSLPFMAGTRRALVAHGMSPDDIDYEVFGPDLSSVPHSSQ